MPGKTEKNLAFAFAAESKAAARNATFAMQANLEGYPQIARLFRAVSEAESVHHGLDVSHVGDAVLDQAVCGRAIRPLTGVFEVPHVVAEIHKAEDVLEVEPRNAPEWVLRDLPSDDDA